MPIFAVSNTGIETKISTIVDEVNRTFWTWASISFNARLF